MKSWTDKWRGQVIKGNGYLVSLPLLPLSSLMPLLILSKSKQRDLESGNEEYRKGSPKEQYAKGLKRDWGRGES